MIARIKNYKIKRREWIIVLIIIAFFSIASYIYNSENSLPIESVPFISTDYKFAVIQTSVGDIQVKMLHGKATSTIENFLKLANSGFYDGTKIHRVTKEFIQGGDPLTKGDDKLLYGSGGPGYTIQNEVNNEKFVRGVFAMASTGKPDTAGSQFFILRIAQAPWLEGKHTIFGKVVSGMDIVDKMYEIPTGFSDIPKTPIIVERIYLK